VGHGHADRLIGLKSVALVVVSSGDSGFLPEFGRIMLVTGILFKQSQPGGVEPEDSEMGVKWFRGCKHYSVRV